jgi:hypothetical protein
MKNVLETVQIRGDGKSFCDHVVNKEVMTVCFGDQMIKNFSATACFTHYYYYYYY